MNRPFYALLLVFLILSVTKAQDNNVQPNYRMPPKAIADLVDAPPTPAVSISPNRELLLLMNRPNLPPITELAQPELRLAGLRINPRTNGKSQVFFYTKLTLMRVSDRSEREVGGLPPQARISNISWAPNGKQIAFTVTQENGIELWVADVEAAQARRLTEPRLNDAFTGSTFVWLSDSRTILCKLVPENRGAAPAQPIAPAGPVIQETVGKKAPTRTYQDLLKNSFDESLFEHYMTSQVVRVSIDGTRTAIGAPGLIGRLAPSPDGKHLLVGTNHRPFSYIVPFFRFPERVEIWDLDGKVLRQIADLPLAEEVPIAFDAVSKGPRAFTWRADAPATLCWAEAQDGGDPAVKTDVRDRLFLLAAPFTGEPSVLASLGLRYGGIIWGNDNLAWVAESWYKTRKERVWLAQPGAPNGNAKLLFDRSSEDRYTDPGNPVLQRTPQGTLVLFTANDGRSIYMIGDGASPEGDRPFLDRLDLETKKSERVWRSEAPYYEYPLAFVGNSNTRLITSRESKTEPPNYYLRDLAANGMEQLTKFPHPTPHLADVHKELIRYKRADGVDLTATLYLPPGYKPEQGPLPMMMWAYPQEFKSSSAASQVTDSPYRFARISWGGPHFLLTQGYAVLDDPAMPIVGEGDTEPNDNYIKQLVASAEAAVNEVVRRGVADRNRIAIGGHSYGAFMTANLLAHSDLFRTGIARSGAYNRTLTPFGFQAEERNFWEAPEVYAAMSPFNHAHKIKRPILLIHGEADNNPGTFPIQSERLYQAIKGLGGTARLVLLPHESHGYRARESVMHMLWEMTEWLDKYVKNAKPE